MKKEKSKVVFSILATFIGILLIVNVIFDTKESSCNLEKDELLNSKTIEYAKLISNFQVGDMSTLWGLFSESIYANTNDNGAVGIFPKDEKGKKFIENQQNIIIRGGSINLEAVEDLNKNIAEKKSECNKISLVLKITLYLALFFSFVQIIYEILIYKSYKK